MTTLIRIDGMTCGGCKKSVEKALSGVTGVKSVSVDLDGGTASVEHDGTEAAALVRAVEDAGFDAALQHAG